MSNPNPHGFTNGLMHGQLTASIVGSMHRADSADWAAYAAGLQANIDQLQSKLKQTQAALEATEAQRVVATGIANGRKDAIDALNGALQSANPRHPLLQDGKVRAIEDAGASTFCAQKGFLYNAEKRSVRKA